MDTFDKTKENEALAKELSELSGEKEQRPFRYTVPVIKFNGNNGHFSMILQDDKGSFTVQELGETISVIILKVRQLLRAYEKTGPKSANSYYTTEHNTKKDRVALFVKYGKEGKPQNIDFGNTDELRERNAKANLKITKYLYVMYGDKICKLSVKGKGLGSYFDYMKEFSPSEHIFGFVTKCTHHNEKSDGGLVYEVIDFAKGDSVPLVDIAPAVREVANAIRMADESTAAQQAKGPIEEIDQEELQHADKQIDKNNYQSQDEGQSPDDPGLKGLKTINVGDDEDEVDVKNIPF